MSNHNLLETTQSAGPPARDLVEVILNHALRDAPLIEIIAERPLAACIVALAFFMFATGDMRRVCNFFSEARNAR